MSGTWLPPEQYLATLPKATVYACFYVTDQDDRPLQLRSVHGVQRWQWPGGNLDHGETPWECAVRECEEETGLRLGVAPRLLATHFLPPLGEWSLNKVGFVFDGGRLEQERIDSIVLDPGEHSALAVRSLENWRSVMSASSYRRLEAVARARRTGSPCHLEHDRPERS